MIPLGVVASAGGAWSPANLSGLALWLDADHAASFTYSSGTVVSQWNDRSGNGRHFVQGTVAQQPTRNATINGLSAVAFDGSDDWLTYTGTRIIAQPCIIAVVFRPESITVNENLLDTDATSRMLIGLDGSPRWRLFAGSVLDATAPTVSVTTYSYVGVYNGASSKVRVDRVEKASGNVGSNGFGDAGSSKTFWLCRGASGSGTHATICEVVVAGTVAAGDIDLLETYLSTKWGTP